MCYNHVQYTSDRRSATVEARCRQHKSVTKLQYNWNNHGFGDVKTFKANSALNGALTLTVKAVDNQGKQHTITVEPQNFIWQNAPVN